MAKLTAIKEDINLLLKRKHLVTSEYTDEALDQFLSIVEDEQDNIEAFDELEDDEDYSAYTEELEEE